jgi:hypothetical protein
MKPIVKVIERRLAAPVDGLAKAIEAHWTRHSEEWGIGQLGWDATHRVASWRVKTENGKVEGTGTLTLTPDNDGTRVKLEASYTTHGVLLTLLRPAIHVFIAYQTPRFFKQMIEDAKSLG